MMGNYPTLEGSAQATVGLQNPDAILGAVPLDNATARSPQSALFRSWGSTMR